MNDSIKQKIAIVLGNFFLVAACASNFDTIGVTLLRETTTNLNGAGIRVAQPEAYDNGTTNWEVNPDAVQLPISLFSYISADGSTNSFPNYLSAVSGHANSVAGIFYGLPSGVATNIAHVDNFDANYFIQISAVSTLLTTNYTATLFASNNDVVVNQSFTFGNVSVGEQQAADSAYDNYAAQYNVLFVSAADNAGISARVSPPGTSYNCISVGAYGGDSSVGPTIDNGRCKPDITAPGSETSFSTPLVAGAAAILMQAGLRGDGGGDTNSAANIRTIKALLLNGAIKPNDWTNIAPSPLDFRYGAGVLNVFNSYEQLAGGKHGYIISTTVSAGGAHPPTGASGTENSLSGWDFNTNSSSSFPTAQDGVNHYYFNVTNNSGSAAFTATITLVWNRQQNQTAINNLELFLYNCANSNLVACSTSVVDNVQHIFLPQLAQSRYDLQILKSAANSVSNSEIYALAWEFFSQSLNAAKSGTNVLISWPIYPAGFLAESTTNLSPPQIWSINNIPAPVVTNDQNIILLNATNAVKFFRLRTPNF